MKREEREYQEEKKKLIRIPYMRIVSYAVISTAICTFVFGSAYAPIQHYSLAAPDIELERQSLEAQLRALEEEIAQNEAQVNAYRQQGQTLQGDIDALNAKISSINLQIRAITLTLQRLNGDISTTEEEIKGKENQIEQYKEYLSNVLQSLYENDQQSAIEMIMSNPRFSDFFLDVSNMLALQDNLRGTLEKVIELKNQLVMQKEALALDYEEAADLRQYQEYQRNLTKQIEDEKKYLLTITKGQESKYQQIVNEKKKTATEIRSRIYTLIGGGELSFGDAYNLAKVASDATGVRTAMILAVLDQESSLGRNVGQCTYDVNPYYPDRAKNKTTMHPTRDIPSFLAILAELRSAGSYVPEPPLVSCPIPRDGAYGGAMGPAQFIPSTWEMYKNRVASVTGNNPPSPWRNVDAFVGTGLYLSDAYNSASCRKYGSDYKHILPETVLRERCAAAQYYAGGRWWDYRFIYGDPVVERANRFEEDIKILNS